MSNFQSNQNLINSIGGNVRAWQYEKDFDKWYQNEEEIEEEYENESQ